MTNINYTSRVFRFAVGSRILVLTLIVFWRSIFSPYDTSASINPSCLSPGSINPVGQSILFPSIGSTIEESIVWDSVYFVRIAQCGYEYEQSYAFLPLLPTIISLISNTVFRPLVPLIGDRAVLALSGYVINNAAFLIAALYFYWLSLAILKDPETSMRASVLFCLNPASIFYSSIYSESLFALLSIGGLYQLVRGSKNISVPWLALSGSARSNGVLNAGYFCYETMHRAYHAISVKQVSLLTRVLCSGLLRCICIFVPFTAFQAYGYYNLCYKHKSNPARPWCEARVPLLYNFIQNHYWNVGFLRYFQIKQLPNFLLASPVLSLAACSIYGYAKFQHKNFFTLGFLAASDKRVADDILLSEGNVLKEDISGSTIKQENKNLKRRRKSAGETISDLEISTSTKPGCYSVSLLPFIYHLGFMTVTAFFVMHVQVSTRFLSASPPVYWFAATLMGSTKHSWSSYLIWAYSVTYIFLGSLLFSNFYPFT